MADSTPSSKNPSPSLASTKTSPSLSPTILTNDNALDDIFGSAPPSPTLPPGISNSGGDAPPSSTEAPVLTTTARETLHSDLPTLKRQHMTNGYREGLSLSKAQHMQQGFDRGYPTGASWGVRAGFVLGVLEGLVRAMGKGEGVNGGSRELQVRQEKLVEARRELEMKRLLEGVEEGDLAEKVKGEQGRTPVLGDKVEEKLRGWEGYLEGMGIQVPTGVS